MSDRSAIEWTEATRNPTTGCDRTSPGCDHCYAQTLAKRLKAMGSPKYQNDGDTKTSGPGFALTLHPTQPGRQTRRPVAGQGQHPEGRVDPDNDAALASRPRLWVLKTRPGG